MANLKEWFEAKWVGESPFEYFQIPGAPEPTRLQVFAAFLAIDGGGYGILQGGVGPYGTLGLEQREAYRWWDMRAYVDGWLAGTDGVDAPWIKGAIKAEHERVMRLVGTWEKYRKEDVTNG